MPPQPPQDNEVDFSNFFKNQPKPKPTSSRTPQKRITKRMTYLIVLLLLLCAVEGWLLLRSKPQPSPIPAGYEWVYPPNAPAYIAPIKK